MHLGNTTTNRYENCHFFIRIYDLRDKNTCICLLFFVYFICRVESAHWDLKRLLHNILEDLCSVWETMNNMTMLQHTEIKTSFETSTHVIGYVYKVTLYKTTTWHGIKVCFKPNYC